MFDINDYTLIKSINSDGIESSLLVGDFKEMEDVICCPICLMILLDPISCGNCSIAMCRKCAKDWLTKNNSCPNRCQSFVEAKLDRLAYKFLSSIKLKCFYFDSGCPEISSYDNFLSHSSNCDYSMARCSHCFLETQTKNIKSHISECPNKLVKCDKCGISIKRRMLNSHIELTHSEQNIKCNHCGIQLREGLMKSHLSLCAINNVKFCKVCEKELLYGHTEDSCLYNMKAEFKQLKMASSNNNQEQEEIVKNLKSDLKLLEFKYDNLIIENKELKEFKTKYSIISKNNNTLVNKISELEKTIEELKKNNKEKEIKICKFHSDGYCKKGVHCDFIHQEKPQPQNSSYLRNEYQQRTNPMFGNNKSSNSNPFDNFFGSSNASNNNNQKRNNTNADTEGCKNQ